MQIDDLFLVSLFIANKIQADLSRSGKFLARDCVNVEPDMIILDKSLGEESIS